MAFGEHANVYTFMNGALLETLQSISHRTENGLQPVHNLITGLAGFSDGSGMVTISGTCSIPITGPEQNFQQMVVTKETVQMQVGVGDIAGAGNGKMLSAELSQSTGGASEISWEWQGELKALE
jgi:hypothetical protein